MALSLFFACAPPAVVFWLNDAAATAQSMDKSSFFKTSTLTDSPCSAITALNLFQCLSSLSFLLATPRKSYPALVRHRG